MATNSVQAAVDELGEKVAEARELMEEARESFGFVFC